MRKYSGLLKIVHIMQILLNRSNIFFHTVRFKMKMRLYKNYYGKNLKIDGKFYLTSPYPSRVSIGDNLKINSRFGSNLVGLTNYGIFQVVDYGQISIGNNCGFSAPVFSSRSKITIGNHVMLGGNVRVFDHDYHSMNPMDRHDSAKDAANVKVAPVRIEDDVFIGTNAIILKGVHIGARSVKVPVL